MIRRIVGAIAAALGGLGLALSIYAGVTTWLIAGQIVRATDETLIQLQAIVEPVHRQSEAAITLVAATRERFDSIRTSVDSLSGDEESQQPEATSILETLDQHVIQRLDTAEEFVRTMQSNMRNASGALLLLDSFPFFSPRLTSTIDQRESQLQSLATGLTELSDLLEQVSQTFAEIRSQSSIDPNQLERLQYGLAQVDSSLDSFELEVRRFSDGIGAAEGILSDIRRKAPTRINGVAILVTVFFVCFGGSQINLLAHGLDLLRSRRASDRVQ